MTTAAPQTEYVETRDVPIPDLQRFPGNAKRGDIDTIRASLRRNGQYRALVVRDTGTGLVVLAGNHTRDAAALEGWATLRCEIHRCDDQTARRINLVDNRAAELGTTDNDALAELLSYMDGDYDGTGYTQSYVDGLIDGFGPSMPDTDGYGPDGPDDPQDESPRPAALNDPDEAPERPAEPRSRTGDLWQLGEHRLAVGDATDPLVWERLLGGDKPDLMWTDPPYGVAYQGKTPDALEIENDDISDKDLVALLRKTFRSALDACRPGSAWYVASPSGPLHARFSDVLRELGVHRQTLVWVKDQFVLGRSDYHYRHELILYGWTPGAGHHAVPDRTQDSVHEVARPRRSREHPTMKPIGLVARHITNSSGLGALVVDPFAGSGSTLIAAHRTGRRAALIELDPRYADVICRRYQEHAGTRPSRDGVEVDFLLDAVA